MTHENPALFRPVDKSETILPNATVLIHFVNHTTRRDAEDIDRLLNDADIYLPEVAASPPQYLTDIQRAANGDFKAYEKVRQSQQKEPFFLAVTEFLYKRPSGSRRIQVDSVDVPHGIYWPPKMRKLKDLYKKFEIHPSIENTLRSMEERVQQIADIQSERDGIIVNNLEAMVKRTPQSRDKGSTQKRPTRILMTIGRSHTSVLTGLQGRGINVQSTQNLEDKNFRSIDVAVRRRMMGEQVDRRLLLRASAEVLLEQGISTEYSHKMDEALFALTERMDDDSMEAFISAIPRQPQNIAGIVEAKLMELTGYGIVNDDNIDDVIQ